MEKTREREREDLEETHFNTNAPPVIPLAPTFHDNDASEPARQQERIELARHTSEDDSNRQRNESPIMPVASPNMLNIDDNDHDDILATAGEGNTGQLDDNDHDEILATAGEEYTGPPVPSKAHRYISDDEGHEQSPIVQATQRPLLKPRKLTYETADIETSATSQNQSWMMSSSFEDLMMEVALQQSQEPSEDELNIAFREDDENEVRTRIEEMSQERQRILNMVEQRKQNLDEEANAVEQRKQKLEEEAEALGKRLEAINRDKQMLARFEDTLTKPLPSFPHKSQEQQREIDDDDMKWSQYLAEHDNYVNENRDYFERHGLVPPAPAQRPSQDMEQQQKQQTRQKQQQKQKKQKRNKSSTNSTKHDKQQDEGQQQQVQKKTRQLPAQQQQVQQKKPVAVTKTVDQLMESDDNTSDKRSKASDDDMSNDY